MSQENESADPKAIPRIECLRVTNYRALRDLQLKRLSPLTVLLGPNGSGKSTVFDVFAFLSECFSIGLRKAWDKRGRFKELRTRGATGPIELEVKYREAPGAPLLEYRLEIDEDSKGPFVRKESLRWATKSGKTGRSGTLLDFTKGKGAVGGEMADDPRRRTEETLDSREMLAVNTLGQFARHPRLGALRRFIADWHLSYFSADNARGVPEAGPQERLSDTGENLANVVQYLQEQHPDRLREILDSLAARIPRLERADADLMADGRLLLQIKDAPFEKPVLARFASDGTLKMLAYLTVLYDPAPPQLIGIEEPENQLHPRLLPELAEECRNAAARSQLMVTTHSPFFVNGLRAEEVWVLYRNRKGYTEGRLVAEMRGIPEFMAEGAKLGHLWMEGFFDAGEPKTASAGPKTAASAASPARKRR